MIEIGKKQCLNVVKLTDFGVYLGTEEDKVLLPKKQVPEDIEVGDALWVFIYRDSKDRLIATTNEPLVMLGQAAMLKVKDVTSIGAFLDWGLEKDLMLPFKEQLHPVSKGDVIPCMLYVDKSSRLCATMKVYNHLAIAEGYNKDDHVSGMVYDIKPDMGALVAVDFKYHGMIPKNEIFSTLKAGDIIAGRITKVRQDGKLDISIREKAYVQMDFDAQQVYAYIESNGGSIPFTDKASPELIKQKLGMGKNAFKRAVGRLLKEGKILIGETSISLK